MSDPITFRFELSITGDDEQVATALERLINVDETSEAEMSLESIAGKQSPRDSDLRDADASRISVTDWSDVILRVSGVSEAVGGTDGDGIDITLSDVGATEDSVVELLVEGDVADRLIATE